MASLTVAMIVKNEADCLRDCLRSVASIADEVVVGDTGSSDTTPRLAASLGARVIDVPWTDDFAAARNAVLGQATGDWILHMDADEVLDPAGAEQIRRLLAADGDGADAVEVTLANYCNDTRAWRWVAVAPDAPLARGYAGYVAVPLLRLFRNRRGYEYREPVHENITESVTERGGVVRAEPILIHHYGYDASPEKARAKALRYRDLARGKLETRPDDPKAWHDFAEQSLACGDGPAAEDACRKVLALVPRHLAAASTLATILLNRGDLDEARALLEDLESAGEAAPHVVTALGAIALRQGRLDEARRRLVAVVEVVPGAIQAWLYLARVEDASGEPVRARAALESARAAAPAIEEVQVRLRAHDARTGAERLFGAGRAKDALSGVIDAMRLDPDDAVSYNDLGVILASLGEHSKAAEAFGRALRLVPGMAAAATNLQAIT